MILSTSEGTWDALEKRLRAELTLLGFQVELRAIKAPESLQELDAMSRLVEREQLVGAVMLMRHGADTQKVRIWLSDAVTDKQVMRSMQLPSTIDEESELVLKIVELLRASLLELRLKKEEPKQEEKKISSAAAAIAASAPLAATERRRLQVALGAEAQALPGLAALFGPRGEVTLPVSRRVRFGVSVGALPFDASTPQLRAAHLGAHTELMFNAPRGALSWGARLEGASMLWWDKARQDVAQTFLVRLGGQLRWQLSGLLGLSVRAHLARHAPALRVVSAPGVEQRAGWAPGGALLLDWTL